MRLFQHRNKTSHEDQKILELLSTIDYSDFPEATKEPGTAEVDDVTDAELASIQFKPVDPSEIIFETVENQAVANDSRVETGSMDLGEVEFVCDPYGASLSFEYDLDGKITHVTVDNQFNGERLSIFSGSLESAIEEFYALSPDELAGLFGFQLDRGLKVLASLSTHDESGQVADALATNDLLRDSLHQYLALANQQTLAQKALALN